MLVMNTHTFWLVVILAAGTFAAATLLLYKALRKYRKRQRTSKCLKQDRQDSLRILNQRFEQWEISPVEFEKMKAALWGQDDEKR